MEQTNLNNQRLIEKIEEKHDATNTYKEDYSYDTSSVESSIYLESFSDDLKEKQSETITMTATTAFSESKANRQMIEKKKYQTIPNELRLKLIHAVDKNGEKIKQAAKRLGINYSSAKSICQVYKKEGRTKKKSASAKNTFSQNDLSLILLKQFAHKSLNKLMALPEQKNPNSNSNLNIFHDDNENGKSKLESPKDKKNDIQNKSFKNIENHEFHNFKKRHLESNIQNNEDKNKDHFVHTDVLSSEKQANNFNEIMNQDGSLILNHQLNPIQTDLAKLKYNQLTNSNSHQQINMANLANHLIQSPLPVPIISPQNNQMIFNPSSNYIAPVNLSNYFPQINIGSNISPVIPYNPAIPRQLNLIPPIPPQANNAIQADNLKYLSNIFSSKLMPINEKINFNPQISYCNIPFISVAGVAQNPVSSIKGIPTLPTLLSLVQSPDNLSSGISNINPIHSQSMINTIPMQNLSIKPNGYTFPILRHSGFVQGPETQFQPCQTILNDKDLSQKLLNNHFASLIQSPINQNHSTFNK